MTSMSPDTVEEIEVTEEVNADKPWQVVVSNDPVNLIPYVQSIFQKVLNLDEATAYVYTMRVHNEGRCVVFSGSREECEAKASVLMTYQLWTHCEKSD